jgi:hypothetical protein
VKETNWRPSVDWRMILKWILRKWMWDMEWIDLVQNKDRWPALVNVVMHLRVPHNVGNLTTC